jgi:hypothetical protein
MAMAAKNRNLVALPSAARAGASGCAVLVRVIAREGDRFRVGHGGREHLVACDPSVDPLLVEEAIATGARVVLEQGPQACIVGALATARAVAIDRAGRVDIEVKRFEVSAEEALIKTASAFVSLKSGEVEIFGGRVLSRARELVRVLARAIQLN